MGGLIIRSALTGVENDDSSYPPVLLVEDVVTLSTPHRGVQYATVADLFFHGVCPVQCQEMRQGSWFLNTWLNDNPQADNGTRWTLIGLDDDIFVSAASAVPNDLPASHKIIYAGGQYLPKADAHMELLWRVGWRFYTLRQCDFRTPNCSMNDRSTFVETTGLWDAITMSRYSVWGWNGPDGLGVVNSGSGGGGGGSGTPPPSHTPPSGAAVKRNDYNRDGNSDIVAVYNDYIHIWFGTGSGGFAYGGSIGSGWTPYASTLTAVGDINGDGNGDLVAIYNDYLHTWFGTGSGGFIYGGAIGSGWTPYASTLTGAGDINGDGRGDLVAVYNDYIHTWFGTSSGGFTYGGPIGSGWTPYANTLTGMGDINRDGKSDLLAISNDYIYTWFGTGSGGFATGGPIGSGWNIYAPIH